jgi:hypothetical protein
MNPLLLRQQQVMRTQMLENQARLLAQRDMLGAAWAADQARKESPSGVRAVKSASRALPTDASGARTSPIARVLLFLMALAVGARLLAAL